LPYRADPEVVRIWRARILEILRLEGSSEAAMEEEDRWSEGRAIPASPESGGSSRTSTLEGATDGVSSFSIENIGEAKGRTVVYTHF
jgi:hypothetical protein